MSVSMTPADRALIESAAKAAGVSVSSWMVHAAREEARWAVARQVTRELAAETGVTTPIVPGRRPCSGWFRMPRRRFTGSTCSTPVH